MSDSSSPISFVAPEPVDLGPHFPGYEILDLIATGGMGAVYRAVHRSLDRTVAIKILPREFGEDPQFRAGFEAEAKAMARLNHPNLIAVFDFGEVNGLLYIVMEFVPGKSLHHSASGQAIDPMEALRLVSGICKGLTHAHENGILHRDIKPSNILLTPQKEPKIGDFGLARPLERKVAAGEVIFGTPGYAAPEVVQAPDTVDHRADLFAVGVVLHELLTGRLPAEYLRTASMMSGCDIRFDTIIQRATDPDPARRYASAGEIGADLQKIVETPANAPLAVVASPRLVVSRSPAANRTPIATVKPKSKGFGWGKAIVVAVLILGYWHYNTNIKPKKNKGIHPQALKSSPSAVPDSPPLSKPAVHETALPSSSSDEQDVGGPTAADSRVPPTSEIPKTRSGVPSRASYFNGKRFRVCEESCTWTEARDHCSKLGGRLVTIPDEATNAFVKGLADGRCLWIGATDEKQEGIWQWIDGTEMKIKSFARRQPDNFRGNEHYLVMWPTGKWNDVANELEEVVSHKPSGYICEWSDLVPVAAGRSNEQNRRLPISGEVLLEGETLNVRSATGGRTQVQNMRGFGNNWSDGTQLWWREAKIGSKLTLVLPVGSKGKYQLRAALTKSWDYGVVRVSLGDKEVAHFFDGYNARKVIRSDELDWGSHDLEAGNHELTITVVDANPNAREKYGVYSMGLDFLKLNLAPEVETSVPALAGQAGDRSKHPLDNPILDIVGTWKYSDTVQLEIRADGTVFSNSKAAGKWNRRDKQTEYLIALNDRSEFIGTLDTYKRNLTIVSRARGVGRTIERIYDGPTTNTSVPDRITALTLECNDLEAQIKVKEGRGYSEYSIKPDRLRLNALKSKIADN